MDSHSKSSGTHNGSGEALDEDSVEQGNHRLDALERGGLSKQSQVSVERETTPGLLAGVSVRPRL